MPFNTLNAEGTKEYNPEWSGTKLRGTDPPNSRTPAKG